MTILYNNHNITITLKKNFRIQTAGARLPISTWFCIYRKLHGSRSIYEKSHAACLAKQKCILFIFYRHANPQKNLNVISFTVDFNLLFTKMLRTSFRTSQIRCKDQKFIMKFTNRFVNWAFDWLVWFNSQSEALFTNLFVNSLWTFDLCNEFAKFGTKFATF
jgi:hypothetical protein